MCFEFCVVVNWYVCVVDCDVFDIYLGGVAFTRKKYRCRFAGI